MLALVVFGFFGLKDSRLVSINSISSINSSTEFDDLKIPDLGEFISCSCIFWFPVKKVLAGKVSGYATG